MPDFAKLGATATRLVDGAGRTVRLLKLDFDAENSEKPWRGSDLPRLRPENEISVIGAFVQISSASQLGLSKQTMDFARDAEAVCLVGSPLDLSEFDELIDSDETRYKIVTSETLRPANLIMLTYLVLRR